MARIPRSVAPWFLPLLLVAGAIAIAVSFWLGLLVMVALLFGVIPYLRLQYLKQRPTAPELRRRNFWDFR